MRLGSRQLTLLDRCRRKGYITTGDVDVVYNFPNPSSFEAFRNLNRHKVEILRKLEVGGYLVQVAPSKWKLTRNGLDVLKEVKVAERV